MCCAQFSDDDNAYYHHYPDEIPLTETDWDKHIAKRDNGVGRKVRLDDGVTPTTHNVTSHRHHYQLGSINKLAGRY